MTPGGIVRDTEALVWEPIIPRPPLGGTVPHIGRINSPDPSLGLSCCVPFAEEVTEAREALACLELGQRPHSESPSAGCKARTSPELLYLLAALENPQYPFGKQKTRGPGWRAQEEAQKGGGPQGWPAAVFTDAPLPGVAPGGWQEWGPGATQAYRWSSGFRAGAGGGAQRGDTEHRGTGR